jgi:SAM-dependent methyltransferase
MAYGTLPNIANAGHEPTPDARAEQITRNLLKLPRSHFTVIDGTCGEGNLLAPFQDNTHAELIGIEINGKWAELAAERLREAQIITAAVEHVSVAPNSISLAVLNPPYLVTNGGRMELQVFRQLCDAVVPHGVIACIIPARSAWDRRFISAWARRCYGVRAWKFPSSGDIEDKAGFERYSQIVVVGYKVDVDMTKLTLKIAQGSVLQQQLATIPVLIDQDAVVNGAAGQGEAWKYFDLGHGYCKLPEWAACRHRMACAKCDFYEPKQSTRMQLLEANGNLTRMLEFVTLDDDERGLVEQGIGLNQALLDRLVDEPTPAGPTPRQIEATTSRGVSNVTSTVTLIQPE